MGGVITYDSVEYIWYFDISSNWYIYCWQMKVVYMARTMSKVMYYVYQPKCVCVGGSVGGGGTYEPRHYKTNKMACAPSLIWVFAVAQCVAKDLSFLHADREDSDQTGWMPRLIWVFTGCTCHFVSFVMRRLILLLMRILSAFAFGFAISYRLVCALSSEPMSGF